MQATRCLTYFCICWPVGLGINPHTKFEVSNFIHSRDIEGVPMFKNRSRDLVHAPTWPNFSIFTRTWLRYVRVFAVADPSVCLSACRLSVCL